MANLADGACYLVGEVGGRGREGVRCLWYHCVGL